MKKSVKITIAIIVIISAALIVGWMIARRNCDITATDASFLPEDSYTEQERAIDAISLCYFVYGCESCTEINGAVDEIIDENRIGILEENFGIVRTDEDDPTTALFDTAEFIRNAVGHFTLIEFLKNERSGFYGAAFCDDEKKCVWIAYSGSVTFKDCLACAGLVLDPVLSSQEKSAFELYEKVMQNEKVMKKGYSVILTGHSLGGAHASMVSRFSGCRAVTINGADGLGIDKANSILGEKAYEYNITNLMTSVKNSKPSMLNIVQRLMYLGSYKAVDCHIYSANSYTTDTHSVFSFVEFENGDFSFPIIPNESKK